MNTADVDNALVDQKAGLLTDLHNINSDVRNTDAAHAELDKLDGIYTTLKHLRGLWQVLTYSYKGVELCGFGVRIVQTMKEHMEGKCGKRPDLLFTRLELALRDWRSLSDGFYADKHV